MENNIEQVNMEFNERARQVFFTLFTEFRQSVYGIDRLKDENVFQKLVGKYVNTLRQQLEHVAMELMQKNERLQHSDRFNQNIPVIIGGYTNEFIQKIKSL